MSRNIGDTSCRFCPGEVVCTEAPRPITQDDAGAYFDEYAGMLVAHAECKECCAQYLAWMMKRAKAWYGDTGERIGDDGRLLPFDLSFRSTFNDEPGADDLPKYAIEVMYLRKPFPTCAECGKRIHYCYGCQCEKRKG
jgi:hypothetical protein